MELCNLKSGIVEWSGDISEFKGIEAFVIDDLTADDFEIRMSATEKKRLLQAEIAKNLTTTQGDEDLTELKVTTALSLAGKTSNALSGSLNIMMQVLGGLAQAQTLADVRNAVTPAMPLIAQVTALVDSGDIVSVQYAQNITDEQAVIEELFAMTQVAKIINAQQPASV